MVRYIAMGLIAALGVALVAACGGGAVTPDENGTVTIELTESAFTPNNIEVTAGTTVRFVLNNEGQEEHEFMIGRVVSRAPGHPDTFETDFFHGLNVNVIGDPAMVMGGEAMLSRNGEMVMEADHDEGTPTAMDGMAMGDHSEGTPTAMDGMAMGDHDEGMAMEEEHGFMISQLAGTGGTVVVVEVSSDKVGTWEIGCFVDEGTHYEDGMKGTLTVVAP